jgi:hypothetical protein
MHSTTHVLKYDRSRSSFENFRSGVSLHSHTLHSRENLGKLPSYFRFLPIASYIIEREIGREHLKTGRIFDFRRMYWTPPLSAREALDLESRQIRESCKLEPLVSLSDHDNIEAGLHLRMLHDCAHTPVSVEWTLPYDQSGFHVGVHNLPADRALTWMAELARYTAKPNAQHLRELLHDLNREPSTLVVLNHPLWEMEGIGPDRHRDCLAIFLQKYGHFLHALELNGMRPREENQEVFKLAETAELPVVAGGDRHGLEPNAVLNLSEATTFAGFVDEVRYARLSQILLMPQFFEPRRLRLLEGALHALDDGPAESGRSHWMSRVFIEGPDGSVRSLTEHMGTRLDTLVDKFRWVLAQIARREVRPAMRFAFQGEEDGV